MKSSSLEFRINNLEELSFMILLSFTAYHFAQSTTNLYWQGFLVGIFLFSVVRIFGSFFLIGGTLGTKWLNDFQKYYLANKKKVRVIVVLILGFVIYKLNPDLLNQIIAGIIVAIILSIFPKNWHKNFL